MNTNECRILAGVVALACVLSGGVGQAQDVAPTVTQYAELRLLPATEGMNAAGEATVGLEFTLDPGWHIYWRSPGDAGLPPEIDWSGSVNLANASVDWPLPERYELLGMQTLAYSDHIIFPVRLNANDADSAITARADVNFLICSEICVPDRAALSITLPPGSGGVTQYAHQIDRYEAQVPVGPAQAGLRITATRVAGEGRDGSLTVAIAGDTPLTEIDLFAEAGPEFVFGKPEAVVDADGLAAEVTLSVQAWGADAADLADMNLVLTIIAGDRAMEQALVPASFNPAELPGINEGPAIAGAADPQPADISFAAFLGILAVAALGGLILNLMPCVLPVLSLKILSVVGHGGGDKSEVRRGFLATAAGILASFLVLAVAAIGLREGGVAVGWGMQFQQPVFLVVMLMIVALFAYSLFGLLEIRLPGVVSDVAATAGGHGQPTGLRGHFLTGAFATLLATPCTAPFVGTALGFALSRGTPEILAIFLAMGIGLALPYLLIAAVPSIATRLPRPGRWMVWLTRIMGLALIATAVWLTTVLASQIGWEPAIGVAALIGVIGAVFAARRFLPNARIAKAGGFAVVALGVAAIISVIVSPPVTGDNIAGEDGLAWQPFDPGAIPTLVADGRTVFVDVTADWCLTCIYNKTAVLQQGAVRALLSDDGQVVAMLADWTNPDPTIAAYLASFGRYGIPFNAVYGPAAPDGIALPELLTQSAVLEAVTAAAGAEGAALAVR